MEPVQHQAEAFRLPMAAIGDVGASAPVSGHARLEARVRGRDWTMWGLLAFALLIRVSVIFALPSLHHPDENFQLFEQAHRLAFGFGIVPWEIPAGIRSPVLPFLLACIFVLAEPIFGGPQGYLAVAKIALALSSLAGVAAVYRMGRRTSPTHALITGLVAASWYELVYFAGRPLTEAAATTVLLVGLSLATVAADELTRRRLLAIGFCLGLCLMLRLHLAVGLLVAAVFVGRLQLRARWWPMMLGGLIPVAIFAAADWIAYGGILHSYVEYFRTNLIQGTASDFGVEPAGWYFSRILKWWTLALPILAALVIVRWRASAIWIATAMAIVVSHSVIPHKEYRFVFPALACFVIVAAMGSADLIERAHRGLGPGGVSRYLLAGSASLWLATSAALALATPFRSEWFRSRPLIESSFAAAGKTDLCGLLFYDDPWWTTGGYAHLHRRVALYAFDHHLGPPIRSTAGFNAVALRRSSIPDFSGEFRVQQCFGSPGGSDVCLMVRDGPCASDPELEQLLPPAMGLGPGPALGLAHADPPRWQPKP
jgi:phosphatidylinositol glycan class B